MGKEVCPHCGSENITETTCVDEEDGYVYDDMQDGKCNDCGKTWVVALL